MEEEAEAEEGVEEDKEEEEEVKPRSHSGDPSVVFERSMWTLTLSLSQSLSVIKSRRSQEKRPRKTKRTGPRPRKQTAACYIYSRGGESKEEVVGGPSIDRLVIFFLSLTEKQKKPPK